MRAVVQRLGAGSAGRGRGSAGGRRGCAGVEGVLPVVGGVLKGMGRVVQGVGGLVHDTVKLLQHSPQRHISGAPKLLRVQSQQQLFSRTCWGRLVR